MAPGNMVVVAMPDNLHYAVVKYALEHDQNVLCVKPLVLKYEQAVEIEKLAFEKGRFVGVEYHKRFDRRSLVARRGYAQGQFGAFVMGEAKLIEPYYYRHSNFQNWFTCDRTDPFTYIGCHYVDLVYFITGLKPVEVSVKGVKGQIPQWQRGFPVVARARDLGKWRAAFRREWLGLSRRRRREQRSGNGVVLRRKGPDGTDLPRRSPPRRRLLLLAGHWSGRVEIQLCQPGLLSIGSLGRAQAINLLVTGTNPWLESRTRSIGWKTRRRDWRRRPRLPSAGR